MLESFISEKIAPVSVTSNNTTYFFPLATAFVCGDLGVTAGQCWLGAPVARFSPMLSEIEPQPSENRAALEEICHTVGTLQGESRSSPVVLALGLLKT